MIICVLIKRELLVLTYNYHELNMNYAPKQKLLSTKSIEITNKFVTLQAVQVL